MERRIADEPLVVDGVGVDQPDRDRDTGRGDHLGRAELREVDPDIGLRGWVDQAGCPHPGRGDPRQPERQGDPAEQGEAPWSAGRSGASHQTGRNPESWWRAISQMIPPIPSDTNETPANQRIAAMTVGSVAPGMSMPASTRDGALAPDTSTARS